jgi:hypothetical protein
MKWLWLCAPLYLASQECCVKYRIGEKASLLRLIAEGAYSLGFLEEDKYRLLAARYETPLEDKINWKESSHIPVLEIERNKTKQKPRIKYSELAMEELQKRYEKADTSERQIILFEAKKRNIPIRKEGAI